VRKNHRSETRTGWKECAATNRVAGREKNTAETEPPRLPTRHTTLGPFAVPSVSCAALAAGFGWTSCTWCSVACTVCIDTASIKTTRRTERETREGETQPRKTNDRKKSNCNVTVVWPLNYVWYNRTAASEGEDGFGRKGKAGKSKGGCRHEATYNTRRLRGHPPPSTLPQTDQLAYTYI